MQLVLSFNGRINFLTAEALLCDWVVQCRNITATATLYLLQFSADVCGLSILYGVVVSFQAGFSKIDVIAIASKRSSMNGTHTQAGSVNCVVPACEPLFI